MQQEIKIQVRFNITRNGNTLNDALYFSPEEYAAITSDQLSTLQEERFSNWLNASEAAKNFSPPPPTVDDLTAGFADLRNSAGAQIDKLKSIAAIAAPELVPGLQTLQDSASAVLSQLENAVKD